MNKNCNISRRRQVPIVKEIHTKVKGRARYKINGLQGSDTLKKYLELRLEDHNDICCVSANPVTGNMLVLYKPARSLSGLASLIESLVFDYQKESKNSVVLVTKIRQAKKKAKTLLYQN